MKYIGIAVLPMAGMNWTVAELGKLNLELTATVEADCMIGLFGQIYFGNQNSLDLILRGKTRRGFYGGIGITNLNIPILRIYKDYGMVYYNHCYLGGKILVGYKF
ncbi:MAG: hypothetical protein MJ188_05995 [Treponema sp.]|nr:hypothetical protein [Treponema sp.]